MKKKRANQKRVANPPMNAPKPQNTPIEGTITKQVQLQRSGPLPVPSELRGYGEIDPGYPERIMRMAEKQLELREYEIKRTKDNEEMEINGRNDMIAGINKSTQTKIWTDFTLVLFALIAMVGVYLLSKDLSGSIVAGTAVVFFSNFGKLFLAYFSKKNKEEK